MNASSTSSARVVVGVIGAGSILLPFKNLLVRFAIIRFLFLSNTQRLSFKINSVQFLQFFSRRFLPPLFISMSRFCSYSTYTAHTAHVLPFRSFDAQTANTPLIGLQHFQFESAKSQTLARLGNFTRLADDQSGNSREIVCLYFHIEKPLDLSYFGRAEHLVTSLTLFHDVV